MVVAAAAVTLETLVPPLPRRPFTSLLSLVMPRSSPSPAGVAVGVVVCVGRCSGGDASREEQ